MRKQLSIIAFSILLASCESQKSIEKKDVATKSVATKTLPTAVKKPNTTTADSPKVSIINQNGVEFFRTNIADPLKNDNTISYGSIVGATPYGYKVVRNWFPAVAQNFRQKYIILHYTALNDDKSISVLTQQAVSAHYLVNSIDDKEIYQLVDENKRAYHAGISAWKKDSNLNDTSIGIEIVNEAKDTAGGYEFSDFPEYQVQKVAALVKDIANRYQIPATNILAHSDIAPTRKQDPGPKFPWKRLYTQYQIGMWYDDETKQNFLSQINPEQFIAEENTYTFIFRFQNMLKNFGYDIVPTGSYDDITKKTVTAFQYHFRPENYSGMMDMETFAILQALLQKYSSK